MNPNAQAGWTDQRGRTIRYIFIDNTPLSWYTKSW